MEKKQLHLAQHLDQLKPYYEVDMKLIRNKPVQS
jgi:hypothetical protein